MRYSYSFWDTGWGITIILATFVAVVFLCIFGVMRVMQVTIAPKQCQSFALATERETKFVRYNAFEVDCLTPTEDGRWIPISQLREFGEQP